MARRRVKSLPSALGQAAAVFILLSVKQGECLQCYWCGPLAEQVHRSQRAQPCSEIENQVTACEPGYTHCAVVASSPPFAESRYCVKFYQDECYTVHCNTTRTYKVTCPCRGELCNGPNTQREIDAFDAVAKIIAKTHNRITKRNAIMSGNFATSGKSKVDNLIQNDADESANADNNDKENETIDSNVPTDMPSVSENDDTNDPMPHNSEPNATPEEQIEAMDPTKPTNGSMDENKETPNMNTVENTPETMKEHIDETTMTKAVETTMKTDESSFVSNEIKPSMQMPTAEALQQNVSPVVTSDKPADHTMMPADHTMMETTTLMSTPSTVKNNITPTPKPSKSQRNSSETSTFSINVLLTCVVIHYILFKSA